MAESEVEEVQKGGEADGDGDEHQRYYDERFAGEDQEQADAQHDDEDDHGDRL